MANKESLTQKTGVVVFARIVTTVIDLALAISILHILDKTSFAVIGFLLMVHEIARNLATIGFPESVFYYFERVARSARKAFILQTIIVLSVFALVAGLLIVVFSYFIPDLLSGWQHVTLQTLQRLLPLIAIVTALEVPTWPTTNILLAADRQKDASFYEIITSALSYVAVVVPLLLGYSLQVAVYGMVAYAALRFLISGVWLWQVLPERVDKNSGISLRSQFTFSIPLGFSSLVGKINRYADKFIVSIILSATAFAEYTVAAQELPIVTVIPFAVGSVLISRYVNLQMREKKEELLKLWYRGIEKVSLMVVPLAILTIISASDLIALFAGSANTSYQDAVIPFQIYSVIMLIRVTHYASILQAFDDTKGVLYLSLNLVVANIILTIPLTIYFGIIGAALGTLIANLYNWYIYLRRIGSHMDLPARRVLPFNSYIKVLGTAVLVGIPVWFSRAYLFADEAAAIGLIWNIVIFLPLFGLIGTLFNVIASKDWKDLREWLSLKFLK